MNRWTRLQHLFNATGLRPGERSAIKSVVVSRSVV